MAFRSFWFRSGKAWGATLGFGMGVAGVLVSISACDKMYDSLEEEAKHDRADRWINTWKKFGTKPGFHKSDFNQHLLENYPRIRKQVESNPGHSPWSVLVPLCGKTRDLSYLESMGCDVVGVEFVQDAIDQLAEEEGFAWKPSERFEEFTIFTKSKEAPNASSSLSIWKGDFFAFEGAFTNMKSQNTNTCDGSAMRDADKNGQNDSKYFQLGYDRAALVAIQPVLRKSYADTMKNLCENMILVTLEYDQNQMQGPPFSVSVGDVYDLYSDHYDIILVSRNDISDVEPHWKKRGESRKLNLQKS